MLTERIDRVAKGGGKHQLGRVFAPAIACLFALGSCTQLRPEASDLETEGLEPLKVGTSGDYPPFSQAGQGFDIEIAERLASDLGRPLQWVSFRWPELQQDMEAGRFDLALGGITWRPGRAVVGRMSRALAAGGPCVVGAREPERIAVNRGGILERWTRERFPSQTIQTTDDNLSLPKLLREGEVDAFVTDSFEVAHFNEAGWEQVCEPAVDRKVYWLSEPLENELGERLDGWIDEAEPWLRQMREQHFGAPLPRDDLDHLIDLLARRLAVMPWVLAAKVPRELPIEDLEREARVLDSAQEVANRHGLEVEGVRGLFGVQIELAKAVQRRSPVREPELDLEDEIRPLLIELGDRIVEALAAVAPIDLSDLAEARSVPLLPWIEPFEIESLLEALAAVEPVD